jgi:tetratricopeptide (TPR) repeat protein
VNRTEDTLTEDEGRRRAEAWWPIEEARTLWNAGLCYARERYEEAEALYARAARICREAFGPEDPRAADDEYWLGESFFRDQKYYEAEAAYLSALATLERAHGPDDPRLAECLLRPGHLRYFVGRYAEAEAPTLRALNLREREHGPAHPLVAQALMQLANLYHHGRGVRGDAEPLYRRAVKIIERTHAGEMYHAECVYRLALFLADSGRSDEAAPRYERALELLDSSADADDWNARWMRGGYADFLRAQGREAEAAEAAAQAAELRGRDEDAPE